MTRSASESESAPATLPHVMLSTFTRDIIQHYNQRSCSEPTSDSTTPKMDTAKSTADNAAQTASSAAQSAKDTLSSAAGSAQNTTQSSTHGGPGQEPVSGKQGEGTDDKPFDQGNQGGAHVEFLESLVDNVTDTRTETPS